MGDYEDALYAQIHARLLQTSTRSLVESILECNDEADDLSQEARSWPASHRNKNAALTKR